MREDEEEGMRVSEIERGREGEAGRQAGRRAGGRERGGGGRAGGRKAGRQAGRQKQRDMTSYAGGKKHKLLKKQHYNI